MSVEFVRIPIPEASEDLLKKATEIINLANAKYDRIFPGLRMDNYPLERDYIDYQLVLAKSEGEVIGTMTLIESKGGLKIELLAVSPKAHGQGMGSQLLAEASQQAKGQGLNRIWLEALDQGNLVNYYLSQGFQEDFREDKPIGFWNSSEPFVLVTLSRTVD